MIKSTLLKIDRYMVLLIGITLNFYESSSLMANGITDQNVKELRARIVLQDNRYFQ
jgi:hypothetical protein